MYKGIFRAVFALLIVFIAASGLGSGAFAMPEALPSGPLNLVELTPEGVSYSFVPVSNSIYDVCLFPVDDGLQDVRAELWLDGELIAAGKNSMLPVSSRLTADAHYILRLSGTGTVRLEIARHALSRCFAMPMEMDAAGDEYAKAIARSGDVHWYSIAPQTGMPVIAAAVTGSEGMRLAATLFGPDGRVLGEAAPTGSGGFMLDFLPEPGSRYYIRVYDRDGGVGSYTLMTAAGDAALMPESLSVTRTELVLPGRSSARLTAEILPAGACDVILWETSDQDVARVSANGRVTGVGEGTAVITAYAPGGLSAQCAVTVEHVPVESVSMLSDSIRMHVGDDASLECELLPANASDPYFEFSAEPAGVVEITGPGVLRAVGEGEAVITVTTRDGGHTASAAVTVEPAVKRYRALLVGQQNYAATVAAERPGTATSVNGLRSMLETLSYDGSIFRVATRMNGSRDQVLADIRDVFSGAAEQDLSVFYITCHGYYADGVTFLQMADGSVLTANELELALRGVPGEVVVMIDCCGSGGVIGRAGTPGDILSGITSVFRGNVGGTAFTASKYKVIASATLEQDSYRVSFDAEASPSGMATVFARALCEAVGWNIDTASRSALRADVNYDSTVTFTELTNYVRRRVMWYLDQAGAQPGSYVQTVVAWPEASTSPLFSR